MDSGSEEDCRGWLQIRVPGCQETDEVSCVKLGVSGRRSLRFLDSCEQVRLVSALHHHQAGVAVHHRAGNIPCWISLTSTQQLGLILILSGESIVFPMTTGTSKA